MKENKNIKFRLTLDEFFNSSKKLAIKGDGQIEDQLLGCALYEKDQKVDGQYYFDEDYMEPLPVLLRGQYVLLNKPTDGLDLLTEERAKELGYKVLDFYDVDCTKYLKGDYVFVTPYDDNDLKERMLGASKKLEESRHKTQKAKKQEETLEMEMGR